MSAPPIYIVTGGEGISGEQIVRTALAQFESSDVPVIIVPHVRELAQIEAAVQEAAHTRGTIVHTLVDADLRQALIQRARQENVPALDLMGGLLSHLTHVLGKEPLGQPGLYRQMREYYFERIEAIEFAVSHDDGRKPHELDQAEIVLIGVSRVGKTPLSIYLSVQGWKTANVPVVPGVDLPAELFQIDPHRIIGLTIDPDQLVAHRRWRQRRLRAGGGGDYVHPEALREQVEVALRLFREHGFAVLDITDKPIEESAAEVIAILTRYFKP